MIKFRMSMFDDRFNDALTRPASIQTLQTFISIFSINSKCILAGGALRTLIDPKEEICDFDLFFTDKSEVDVIKRQLEFFGFKKTFQCPNGFLTSYKKSNVKVQLITEKTYSSIKELLNSFDINACRFAYDGEFVYTFKEAIRDVKKKNVTLNRVEFPAATFKRFVKYQKKGYYILNSTIEDFVDRIWEQGLLNNRLDNRFYID